MSIFGFAYGRATLYRDVIQFKWVTCCPWSQKRMQCDNVKLVKYYGKCQSSNNNRFSRSKADMKEVALQILPLIRPIRNALHCLSSRSTFLLSSRVIVDQSCIYVASLSELVKIIAKGIVLG